MPQSGPAASSTVTPDADDGDRTATRSPRQNRGAMLVRVAALWLLAGALAKTFTGTPSELPSPILNSDLDPFLVIPTAVVIETAVAIVALLVPAIGWLPLAGALLTFTGILIVHVRGGAEHCGCFGGAFPIPAWVMLATDASLAIIVVAAAIAMRPWRRSSPLLPIVLGGGLLAVSLGWFADARLRPLRPVESRTVVTRPPVEPTQAERPPIVVPITPPPVAPEAWSLPAQFPGEVILRPITWLNKKLADTELGRWTDTSLFPPNAELVLYYESCSHCAAHLRELATRQDADPSQAPAYVLVQLPTPIGPNVKLHVDRLPKGLHVELPKEITRWVITPPWDVFIEGGVVKRAERIKWPGEK